MLPKSIVCAGTAATAQYADGCAAIMHNNTKNPRIPFFIWLSNMFPGFDNWR